MGNNTDDHEVIKKLVKLNHFSDDECSQDKRVKLGAKRQKLLDKWFREYACGEVDNFVTYFTDNYDETSEDRWLPRECLQRIAQSMVNELEANQSVLHCNTWHILSRFSRMFAEFVAHSSIALEHVLAEVLNVLQPLFSNHLPPTAHYVYAFDWTKHRNTCMVLISLFDCDASLLATANRKLRRQLFDYFLWIIDECVLKDSNWEGKWEGALYAVVGVQKVALEFGLCNRKSLANAFAKLTELLNIKIKLTDDEQKEVSVCPITSMTYKSIKFDSFRHQVELAISWFSEHVLEHFNMDTFYRSPVIFSPDKLSARCADSPKYSNAHSKYKVQMSQIFYYEVVLITDGPMRIGWSCNVAQPGVMSKLGSDKYSIGYDGHSKRIYHLVGYEAVQHYDDYQSVGGRLEPVERWRAGDVIGCLIALNQGICDYFEFYLNGKLIKYKRENVLFSANSPEYRSFQASVTLSTGQQCHFNFGQFGQSKFKHLPETYDFIQNFHEASGGNAQNYQLMERTMIYTSRGDAERIQDKSKQIDKYQDDTQKLFDLVIGGWLRNTKRKLCSSKFSEKDNVEEAVTQLLRLSQSIVNLVVHPDALNLYEYNANFYQLLMPTPLNSAMINGAIPEMLDMFQRYTAMQTDYNQPMPTTIWSLKNFELKLRNMCLMFVLVLYNIDIEQYPPGNENYNTNPINEVKRQKVQPLEQLFTYLQNFVQSCENQEALLYALMCIEMLLTRKAVLLQENHANMKALMDVLQLLAEQQNLWHHSSKCKKVQVGQLASKKVETEGKHIQSVLEDGTFLCAFCSAATDDPILEYRVGFYASSCLAYIKNALKSNTNSKRHIGRNMEWLKFSQDHLSVASGLNKSFGGMAHSRFAIVPSNGTAFFESTHMTDGPAVVGWTTLTDLTGYEDIVGLDLYRSLIWANGQCFPIYIGGIYGETKTFYKVDDVVGCGIEFTKQKQAIFSFYYNGSKIDFTLPEQEKSRHCSYYPAVYIEQHQHCYLNFGQAPFRYPVLSVNAVDSVETEENCSKVQAETKEKFRSVHALVKGEQHRYNLVMKNVNQQLQPRQQITPAYESSMSRDKRFFFPGSSYSAKQIQITTKTNFVELLDEMVKSVRVKGTFEVDLKKKLNTLNDVDVIALLETIIFNFDSNIVANKLEVLVGLTGTPITHYRSIKEYVEKLMATTDVRTFERNIWIALWILHRSRPIISPVHVHSHPDQHMATIEVEIMHFTAQTLIKSEDNWSRLCALYWLQAIWEYDKLSTRLLTNSKLFDKLEKLASQLEHVNYSERIEKPIEVQVGLCAQHFLKSTKANKSDAKQEPKHAPTRVLKPCDNQNVDCLLLSNDGYLARNNDSVHNVYVQSSVTISTGGIFYFETTLLTSGSIQVGWITQKDGQNTASALLSMQQQSHIDKDSDTHVFGIDLQDKSMWLGKSYDREMRNFPECTAGDVIGCFIDVSTEEDVDDYYRLYTKNHTTNDCAKKVLVINSYFFTLNGKMIPQLRNVSKFKKKYTNEQHLIATIGLGLYQQCYCNLGQVPFRFKPGRLNCNKICDLILTDDERLGLNSVSKTMEEFSWRVHPKEICELNKHFDMLNKKYTK